jgi:hypothetical protein
LFRDKDFLGENVGFASQLSNVGGGVLQDIHKILRDLPASSQFLTESQSVTGREYTQFNPTAYLTLVRGVTGETSTSQFKATRGGSAYVSSRPIPGGPIENVIGQFTCNADLNSSVMVGIAALVRSLANDELQMVVMTHSYKPKDLAGHTVELSVLNSTAGAGEGYSAVDVFRIEGLPLIKSTTRYEPDLTKIVLAREV